MTTKAADLRALRIDRGDDAPARPRRRPWRWVAAGLLVALAGWLAMRAFGPRVAEVQVAPAVAHRGGEAVRGAVLAGTGYVVTGEKYIAIGVRVAGRIERYYADEGQSVKAGDALVAIDDRDYRARLDRAEAALATARANLVLHASELGRAERLHRGGIIATQELEQKQNLVAVDRARIGELEAEAALARVELDYTVLRAPRDGVILAKLKEVGEIAVPGGFSGSGDLIRMANLDDMRAEVDVNESDLTRVRLGQGAEVIPDAYPDARYPATVVKLYPQVNRQKGTLKVEVRVARPDDRLLPDMSVRVNFLAEATPTAGGVVVLAPRAALRRDEGGAYVWLLEGGRVRRRAVMVGAELGERVQIADGLVGAESLVVGDAAELVEGAEVKRAAASAGAP
ncbi:MAG: efflux RND transporter periplasmic adaptor subunit [Deltaproteobacteria bacterium]|nr:efflux RND transporter periplasmic adaptor subunit [Deltaproteobacteria bacterium]